MSTPRLAIIVFARMSSHRLPGKVLMDFGGRPLLAHIIERARALGQPVIVATSERPEDAAVADLALTCGARAFRGPLDDVLQRAVDCAHEHRLDAFARLCGDRPYFPQATMREALAVMTDALTAGEGVALVTNHLPANPPPGLSTEVVCVDALERVLAANPSTHHCEHLTAYLYDHRANFRIRLANSEFLKTRPHRFAVDTPEDHERLGQVGRQLADIHATPEAVAECLAAMTATDPA